jgi:predicted SnoaL-like aldol condensation-catalyzing enzyme
VRFSKLKLFAGALALLAMGVAPGLAQSKNPTPQEKKNLAMVLDWWRVVVQGGHVEEATKYADEDMIQHNPNAPNGLEPLRKIFGARRKDPLPAKLTGEAVPAVAFAKGDYVALVFEHEAKDPADPSKMYKYNSFDLFRIENGKIKEHWDAAMKAPPR